MVTPISTVREHCNRIKRQKKTELKEHCWIRLSRTSLAQLCKKCYDTPAIIVEAPLAKIH
jgi:hypothetical protein